MTAPASASCHGSRRTGGEACSDPPRGRRAVDEHPTPHVHAPHTTRACTPFAPPALQATKELMYEFAKGGPGVSCGWIGANTGQRLDKTIKRVKMYDAVVPNSTTGVTEWQREGPLPDTPPGSLDMVGAACAARNLSTAGDMAARWRPPWPWLRVPVVSSSSPISAAGEASKAWPLRKRRSRRSSRAG